jgi:hypothetical protein
MNDDYAASGIIAIVPTPRSCRMFPKRIRLPAVWRGVPCLANRWKSA